MDAADKENNERNNELSENELDNKIKLEIKKREIIRKLKGESR